MNRFTLVSVIMPAYNSASLIVDSIDSVLNQTYQNIELIVVDDGSKDNTVDIVKEYYVKDKRVQLIQQENAGVSAARNVGLRYAGGSIVAFCDSDDIWYPHKLEKQLASMVGFKWCHCDSRYFGVDYDHKNVYRSSYTNMIGGDIFEALLEENLITTSSVLIDKELILKHNGFDEEMKALEDWKLWLAISKEEPIIYHDEVLLDYRVLQNSTSRKARELLPTHLALLDEFFEHHEVPMFVQNNAYYKAYSIFSFIAEENNDYDFSFSCAKNLFQFKVNGSTIKRFLRTYLNKFRV